VFSLFAKIFIKNHGDFASPSVRRAYGVLASLLGICLNILLFCGKYFAGIVSGSIAITADAFNNLSDAGSSVITLLGFRLAGVKPDADHPFGHGRAEYLSGLVVSMVIILMGLELGKSSVEKIISPSPVDTGLLPLLILAVSVCVKAYMFSYNRGIGKKINSVGMRATAMDSLSDVAATTVVLISALIMRFSSINIDGWCGAAVALFILYTGYKSAKDTLSPLLGNAPEAEFVKNVESIVLSHGEIVGMHDLVVHDYGPGRVLISLHAEVDGGGNIYENHDVIDRIEAELMEGLGCDATIHMDPIDIKNGELASLRAEAADIARSLDERITIHDFRIVPGPTHSNLIFDAVVPFDCSLPDEEVIRYINGKINEKHRTYFCIIRIDKPYVQN